MITGLALSWALLAAPAAAPDGRVSAPRQGVVLPAVENMYSGPDAGRDVVSQALLGQLVDVLEERDGFLHVQTPDGYRGWLPRPLRSTASSSGRGSWCSSARTR